MKRRRAGKKGRRNFHIFYVFFCKKIFYIFFIYFCAGGEDLYQQGSEMDELIQIKDSEQAWKKEDSRSKREKLVLLSA